MRNITKPHSNLFQVRVRRGGRAYSASFSAVTEGSIERAISKAVAWRDELISRLGDIDRVGQETKKNLTSGIHGVSVKIKKKGKQRHKQYLYFCAHFKNENNEHKNREFSAGNITLIGKDDAIRVFKVCLLFRKSYENSRLSEEGVFCPKDFLDWKTWNDAAILAKFCAIGVSTKSVDDLVKKYIKNQRVFPKS